MVSEELWGPVVAAAQGDTSAAAAQLFQEGGGLWDA